jgi:hypothetical protein
VQKVRLDMLMRTAGVILLCALAATGAPASSRTAFAAGAPQHCRERDNDTVAKLEACIQQGELMGELAQFQKIADDNPGPTGHGNRDTGTPGYLASVNHVAGLMRRAGYTVAVQPYTYSTSEVIGSPQFAAAGRAYSLESDWYVARLSGAGTLTAAVAPPSGAPTGCAAVDFAGFAPGNVALIERGDCAFDVKVANARAAGAAAVVLYNAEGGEAYEARLTEPASIPVVGVTTHELGAELLLQYLAGTAPTVRLDIRTQRRSGTDYNLIADSPYGNPNQLVIVEGHLDSIYGAGMLDNASGSTTMLDVALNLAKTPTTNRLRYIWFGGEELGLLGSHYYTRHLTAAQLAQIAFDVDVDVVATPNFDYLVADPEYASNVEHFPSNVVPESKLGNDLFAAAFQRQGVVSQPARFGNDGTDSNSFSLVGVPDSGVLTNQDCCKRRWETAIWGGYLGNYEGLIPSFNGGCVDYPHRWCDNLYNNDPAVFELVSKVVADVTLNLAETTFP